MRSETACLSVIISDRFRASSEGIISLSCPAAHRCRARASRACRRHQRARLSIYWRSILAKSSIVICSAIPALFSPSSLAWQTAGIEAPDRDQDAEEDGVRARRAAGDVDVDSEYPVDA